MVIDKRKKTLSAKCLNYVINKTKGKKPKMLLVSSFPAAVPFQTQTSSRRSQPEEHKLLGELMAKLAQNTALELNQQARAHQKHSVFIGLLLSKNPTPRGIMSDL